MTSVTPPRAIAPSQTLSGIVCVIVGMALFAGQDSMMKAYLPDYPIWMLIFARSCVAVLVLVPLILLLGGPHRLTSRFWRLHLLRGALFAVGFSIFYMAFPFMGLAEATTIFFSAPLMIALIAVIFLKERIGKHRIGALCLGFAGVVIAINPIDGSFTWVSVLPLVSALLYASSQVLARQIGDQESSLTVGLFTLAWSAPVVLITGFLLNQIFDFGTEFQHLRWDFPIANGSDALGIFFLALLGMGGYVLLSRAYQIADPSKISLFDYSYLPIATAMAWITWAEVPPTNTIVGMALIVIGGAYIGYREMHAARDTGDPALVAETIIAPGNPLPGQSADEDGHT